MASNDLTKELGSNFIEYAAAVNGDRAIPDARSGLKPVARRVLWGAYASGYTSNKEHVKCARLVGEVMGSLHPHGDSSIYGAMVHLSQPWVMRYPLLDFHGNMGNIGGDGPAAYRYTNIRLAKIAEDGMLAGIKKKTVDFIPNYDENDEEPTTLPAIFPNLLCNPNTGIGVALASNFLPHNLTEVAKAINEYLDGQKPTLAGPDFPTGGIVINANDIPKIMETGHGSVKVRGKYKIEKQNIIFYEIPYGVNTESILTEIGEASDKKEIEGINDIRDESNKKGLRLVIECQKGVNPENVVKYLFAKTNLQTSISYNQIALVDKVPTEVNLEDCIKIYVNHNIECIVREAKFDLNKAIARCEIVNGLLKALEDIDNIVALIKKSKSSANAVENLIKVYSFTANQAKAIVDMKLGKLAGLEKIELQEEKAELDKNIKELNSLIDSEDKQKQTLRNRLAALVEKFGDARRTELIQLNESGAELEAAIPAEKVIVTLEQNGNITRIPSNNLKVQKRAGKGTKTATTSIISNILTTTAETLMVFSNMGKMYKLPVNAIPAGKGVSINTIITLASNENIIAITSYNNSMTYKYVVFFTKQGLMKKSNIQEYVDTKRSTGITAIKLKPNDTLVNVEFMNEEDIIAVTKCGMAIRFETKDIAAIGRNTSGVKTIDMINGDELLVGLPVKYTNQNLVLFNENGSGKKVSLEELPIQGRGGKGLFVTKVKLASAMLCSDTDTVMIVGTPNSLCFSIRDLALTSRTSAGSIIIKQSKILKASKI